jgi:hypothetical protein
MKIGIDYITSERGAIIFNAKTYVLDREGKPPLIKGNTLKSRKYEPFIRKYILECIDYILKDEYINCSFLYLDIKEAIEMRAIPITEIAQRQTLNSSLTEYQSKVSAKQRNEDGAYNIAITDPDFKYEKGDIIEFYISEPPLETVMVRNKEVTRQKKLNNSEKAKHVRFFNNDYDIKHYTDRLNTVTKTVLLPIFGIEEFGTLFPEIKITGADIKKIEKLNEHDYEIE